MDQDGNKEAMEGLCIILRNRHRNTILAFSVVANSVSLFNDHKFHPWIYQRIFISYRCKHICLMATRKRNLHVEERKIDLFITYLE